MTMLRINHLEQDFGIEPLDATRWRTGETCSIEGSWRAEKYIGRELSVSTLWSKEAFYIYFSAEQTEPLVVSERPVLTKKAAGLWERDVCEIFIAPDKNEPRRYFEFEVAPTGEWLDVAIDSTSGERTTDWEYRSGMEAASRIEDDRIVMAMKVPWEAFGRKPKAGDVWLGNIFRCVGREPNRGYLAWQPTMTEKPNFHVPEKFGQFVFIGGVGNGE